MNLTNHFLIATPQVADMSFQRSVVYICEHNEQGAMGLIINRPLPYFPLAELMGSLSLGLPKDMSSSAMKSPILYGGPIAQHHAFVLHSTDKLFSSSIKLTDTLAVTISREVIEAIVSPTPPDNALIFLGYSSWGNEQLEDEIIRNDWLTLEADNDLLFNTPLNERWEQAGSKLGIQINRFNSSVGHA